MEIFDNVASEYDSWYETEMGAFVDKVETGLAFGMFKVPQGSVVLDIGCGTGNFSIKLAKMGCRVIGMDISEKMLDIARKKTFSAGMDIQFFNMDVYNLKFRDESFDAVFSMAAFEFLHKPEEALDELFRVTVKSGKVLVGTINADSAWGRLYMSDQFRENTVFGHASLIYPDRLTKLRKTAPVRYGECLFISPDSSVFNDAKEREMKLNGKRGGFICALWEK